MSAPERPRVQNLQMTVAIAVILVLQLWILAKRPSPDEDLRKQLGEVSLKLEALANRSSSPRSETTSVSTTDSSSAASDEFNDAVSLTEACLAKQDFSAAFDIILAASRIAPSNPRLLDLVTEFVENAKHSKSDDTEALVDELLERCDSLVHYQRPKDVVSSRQRLLRLRMPFVRPVQPSVVGSRFESVLNFLLVAENSSVPLGMRSKAADRARQDFESTLLNTITSAKELPELLNSDEVKQLSSRIENVEKQSVLALFQQSRTKVDQWLVDAGSLQSASDSVDSDRVPEISSNISAIIARGYDQLDELTRFAGAGIPASLELSKQVEKQLKSLQRRKKWLYNQQVLRRVREVETNSELSYEDKVNQLADVRDELLWPYIARRHYDVWEKAFEALSEDRKVWALKLRILQTSE